VETGPSRRTLWVKGYPIPGILQSVRKWLNARGIDGHGVWKCEASVRKEKEAPLPFDRGKKELEKTRALQEAVWAASRRFPPRRAKAAFPRG
jgi:hypothetical protein